MKIKEGDKIPNSDFFYIDESGMVKKIKSTELLDKQKAIVIGHNQVRDRTTLCAFAPVTCGALAPALLIRTIQLDLAGQGLPPPMPRFTDSICKVPIVRYDALSCIDYKIANHQMS